MWQNANQTGAIMHMKNHSDYCKLYAGLLRSEAKICSRPGSGVAARAEELLIVAWLAENHPAILGDALESLNLEVLSAYDA
jgi:hypothetical protein